MNPPKMVVVDALTVPEKPNLNVPEAVVDVVAAPKL
jgi:hypothetical protein